MAYSRTPVSEIVESARQRADLENSAFIGDDEALKMVNSSAKELYDLLIGAHQFYRVESVEFTIPTGSSYPLPDDFYKGIGVDVNINSRYLPLKPFNFLNRNRVYPPYLWPLIPGVSQFQYRYVDNDVRFIPEEIVAGYQFRLWYTPRFTEMEYGAVATGSFASIRWTALASGSAGNSVSLTYVTGGIAGSETVATSGSAITVAIESGSTQASQIVAAVNADPDANEIVRGRATRATTKQAPRAATLLQGGVDDSTLDGVDGWEEYVIVDAAMKMLVKEESDTSDLMNAKLMLKQRIEQMAVDRDEGMPETITDVNTPSSGLYGWYPRF